MLAEARWIIAAVAVAALAAVLLSYHRDDPGFTHSLTAPQVRNLGGLAGAWVADALLMVFGFSAGIWVAAGAAWVARGLRRL
ncbi:MAG TPA: DNA translocase FtsK 4TM domain-containing protein, partial [Burkholderiaceae bacterium]